MFIVLFYCCINLNILECKTFSSVDVSSVVSGINLNILECKKTSTRWLCKSKYSINLNILECKYTVSSSTSFKI